MIKYCLSKRICKTTLLDWSSLKVKVLIQRRSLLIFHVLSDNGKPLLSKGLNFSLPWNSFGFSIPQFFASIFHFPKVEISAYICLLKLLHCEVSDSDFSKESIDKELLKSRLKEMGLFSHCRLKFSALEENLSKNELESFNLFFINLEKKISNLNLLLKNYISLASLIWKYIDFLTLVFCMVWIKSINRSLTIVFHSDLHF